MSQLRTISKRTGSQTTIRKTSNRLKAKRRLIARTLQYLLAESRRLSTRRLPKSSRDQVFRSLPLRPFAFLNRKKRLKRAILPLQLTQKMTLASLIMPKLPAASTWSRKMQITVTLTRASKGLKRSRLANPNSRTTSNNFCRDRWRTPAWRSTQAMTSTQSNTWVKASIKCPTSASKYQKYSKFFRQPNQL